mgnify:CR=1 FL=1
MNRVEEVAVVGTQAVMKATAADYMSGYEMTGGGSFADIFPAADEVSRAAR